MVLELATQIALIAAGAIFLWALILGVWKFVAIARSVDGRAHVYIDIAHRAALMYAFATALLAVFVQFSAFATAVNVTALSVTVFFFVAAIASYCLHGALRDTDNQVHPTSPMMIAAMVALIIGEVGGSAVIITGFVVEQVGSWG